MTPLKNFLLRLLFPAAHCRLQRFTQLQNEHHSLEQQSDWLDRELRNTVRRTTALQHEATSLAQQLDLCLNQFVPLVAINEHGHWTTVLPEDAPLTQEMNDYLHALVARA